MITVRNRFVLPVLPIALMFSGYSLAAIEDPGSARYKGKESSKSHTRCPGKMKIAILFLLATNIPMALYMSLVHQVSLLFSPSLHLDLMLLIDIKDMFGQISPKEIIEKKNETSFSPT